MVKRSDANPEAAPVLPASGAFVVQFAQPPNREPGAIAGRVEHVVSGRSARFGSWGELRDFVTSTLAATA
jgi:hypothetical protein